MGGRHFSNFRKAAQNDTMTGWLMQRVIVVNYLKKNGANTLRQFSSSQKFLGGGAHDPGDLHIPDHGGEKCIYPHKATNIGNREIVGFGINGQTIYHDDVHVPFPSIRFKERTNSSSRPYLRRRTLAHRAYNLWICWLLCVAV